MFDEDLSSCSASLLLPPVYKHCSSTPMCDPVFTDESLCVYSEHRFLIFSKSSNNDNDIISVTNGIRARPEMFPRRKSRTGTGTGVFPSGVRFPFILIYLFLLINKKKPVCSLSFACCFDSTYSDATCQIKPSNIHHLALRRKEEMPKSKKTRHPNTRHCCRSVQTDTSQTLSPPPLLGFLTDYTIIKGYGRMTAYHKTGEERKRERAREKRG